MYMTVHTWVISAKVSDMVSSANTRNSESSMKGLVFVCVLSTVLSQIMGVFSTMIPQEVARRTAATCADPTLAETYIAGFTPSGTAHVLQRAFAFIDAASRGSDWQIQRDIFRGWGSPQEFTVPFYALYNPITTDYIYIVSTTGNPPVASGFQVQGIIGYVYSTQVCGSVPLYEVFQDVIGDHWYTTLANERDSLVGVGWINSGIAAYVLPL